MLNGLLDSGWKVRLLLLGLVAFLSVASLAAGILIVRTEGSSFQLLLVIAVLGVVVLLFVAQRLHWLLYLWFAITPFQQVEISGGIVLGVVTDFLALLVLIWFVMTQRQQRRPLHFLDWIIAAFLVLSVLSNWVFRRAATPDFVPTYVRLLGVYFAVAFLGNTRRKVIMSLRWLVASTAIGGVVFIGLYYAGFSSVVVSFGTVDRLQGLGYGVNTLGQYAATITVGLFVLLASQITRKGRGIVGVALIPIGAVLILSASRGALIATTVALAAFMLFQRQRRFRGVVLALALTLAALVFSPAEYLTRMTGVNIESVQANPRLDIWQVAIYAASRNLLYGIGIGNFPLIFREQLIYSNISWPYPFDPDPHNSFLAALVEMGVAGLLFYVAVIVGVLWALWRAQRQSIDREDPDYLAMLRFLLFGLLAFVVAGFFFSAQRVRLFYLMAGLASAAYHLAGREDSVASPAGALSARDA